MYLANIYFYTVYSQHKSPDASANDRGVIELPELPDRSPPTHSPNTSDATSGESNKRKMFSLCHTQTAKPKRLSKPTPIKNKDTSRKVLKECNLSLQPVMSPRVKVPRPRLGRSKLSETPTTSSRKENSLFGFEDLRTPRGLSPVISEVDDFTMSELVSGSPHKSGLEQSVKKEARAYRVPSKKRRNKKAGFVSLLDIHVLHAHDVVYRFLVDHYTFDCRLGCFLPCIGLHMLAFIRCLGLVLLNEEKLLTCVCTNRNLGALGFVICDACIVSVTVGSLYCCAIIMSCHVCFISHRVSLR